VEYGDPNPKLTAAKAKAAKKAGKPAHPTLFRRSYFSPLPRPHPLVKCFGKGEKSKCYAVDPKTKQVLGKPDPSKPFTIQYGVTGRSAIETPALHAMEQHGFVEPAYDDNLQRWKPKKSKLVLVPAPVMSFAQIHFEAAAAADAEAEAEAEAEAAPVPERPTTKLTGEPVIVPRGKAEFYGPGHRLPQFTYSKVEAVDVQRSKSAAFQFAAVHPPSFFKPQPNAKPQPRFAAADASEVTADELAADTPELSAVPTAASLPPLQLEAADEQSAKELYSEVKALLSAKAPRS
jgi:hypothetical protein